MLAASTESEAPPRSSLRWQVIPILWSIGPFLVVFLGFALRVWRVTEFSINSDELDSLLFARMPLRELFGALATREPHPPLYYLFLHGWVIAAGQSELPL